MTTGVWGTGPYGEMRILRNDIKNYRYELRLIERGMRRPIGKKRLQELVVECQEKIKAIKKAHDIR